jgi:hypothetical protein
MGRLAVVLLAAVAVAVAAPGAFGANRAVFTDATGDACCTEDITQVVVSNDDAGMISFAITAPLHPDSYGGASDRFIEIQTERGDDFVIGTNPDGPGYVLQGGGRVRASHVGDLFRFFIDRHRLGDTDHFTFSVAFWSVSSLGANVDGAGTWPYDVKLSLGRIRPSPSVRQKSARLTAELALRVGRSNRLLASGTIVCSATVGRRVLRVVRREFVARRAVCVWEVPRRARGTVVRGAIGVRVTAARGSVKARSFRLRVA